MEGIVGGIEGDLEVEREGGDRGADEGGGVGLPVCLVALGLVGDGLEEGRASESVGAAVDGGDTLGLDDDGEVGIEVSDGEGEGVAGRRRGRRRRGGVIGNEGVGSAPDRGLGEGGGRRGGGGGRRRGSWLSTFITFVTSIRILPPLLVPLPSLPPPRPLPVLLPQVRQS